MDTLQIMCTLRDVESFLGVFASDMLPPPRSITRPGTIIVNIDPHTHSGSHWIAINLRPRTCSSYFFDSYGLFPFVPDIRDFLEKSGCPLWNYNKTQLQGLYSTLCGHYCCLFALYMDRGYSPSQFIDLFYGSTPDVQVVDLFKSNFGHLRRGRRIPCGGQCCKCLYKVRNIRIIYHS